jgi:hypothetical protein
MNFQLAPKPHEFTWTPPKGNGKTKTAAATFGGRRISIQVPPSHTRFFREQSSTTLYFVLDSDIHKKFQTFIENLESHASDFPHATNRELSSCIRQRPGEHPSFRLNIWETQWFDQSGGYMKDPPMTVEGCSCILEFNGCWVGESSWGLRWKAVQIQLVDMPEDIKPLPKPQFAFLD